MEQTTNSPSTDAETSEIKLPIVADIRKLANGSLELAYCILDNTNIPSFSPVITWVAMYCENTLSSFFNFIKDKYEYLIVFNLPHEFSLFALKTLPSCLLIELNTIEGMMDLMLMHSRRLPTDCPKHLASLARGSSSCAKFNVNAVQHWLNSSDGIMKIVCSIINKFRNNGLQSFNKFDWKYFPTNILSIYEPHRISLEWEHLPDHLKQKFHLFHPRCKCEYCIQWEYLPDHLKKKFHLLHHCCKCEYCIQNQ